MPFTTIAEFEATETPTPAELALIAACRKGNDLTLPIGATETTLPPEGHATPDRAIRAELLRLLIMGGTKECCLHPSGVVLLGARITGLLDLRYAKAIGRSALVSCRFDEEPRFDQAHFAELILNSSHLPGLFAQGIMVTGSVFLRGLTATGTVDVNAAKITGQLDCTGATLDGGKDTDGNQQNALNAEGAQVGGSLVLENLAATGTVDVNGANITGQLDCTGATLDGGKDAKGNQQKALRAQSAQIGAGLFLSNFTAKGTVAVVGAEIAGQMICTGATLDGGKDAKGNQQEALNGQRLHVGQSFFFRNLKSVSGQVYLDAAHVGDLVDDAASWPMGTDQLYLNGFTYDRIADGPLTLAGRKEWLAKGSRVEGTFHPQPYTQFARVLRAMGHAAEARKVLIESQYQASRNAVALNRFHRKAARAIRHLSLLPNATRFADLQALLADRPAAHRDFLDRAFKTFKALHSPQPTPPDAPPPLPATTMVYARKDFRNRLFWAATKARLRIAGSWCIDVLFRRVIGYGHAPHRAIYAMLVVIVPFAVFFHYANNYGVMVPNSDVILTSASWWWAMLFDTNAPTQVWAGGSTARHYETFYALAYAFDVFVPLVDLGQQAAWTATTVNWLGWSARVLTMALEVIGWIITALAAASITGLVQKNQPD